LSALSKLVFVGLDGDKRDDYLIWDDEGGLTGFLNQHTFVDRVPIYIPQGGPKTIADGISQDLNIVRLADIDGDVNPDYVYVDHEGALWLWWNRGIVDTSMTVDSVQFADIDGNGLDDHIYVDPVREVPMVYKKRGLNDAAPAGFGWYWEALNVGRPIAAATARAGFDVKFVDIDGDGLADYLVTDRKIGELFVHINGGPELS
jgi:hypothetical protein